MSSNGQVVAFYGRNVKSPYQDKLCVHDFETTAGPVEVNLDSHNLGSIFENSGLVSNADGTRIFFVADDTRDVVSGDYRFCRVNGTAGDVTVMQDAIPSNVEVPLDIATDATGEYLYFNETDNGNRGDLWRIQAAGGVSLERIIQADTVPHPSGGVGRFVDQFDASDDGSVIAFFIEGRNRRDACKHRYRLI